MKKTLALFVFIGLISTEVFAVEAFKITGTYIEFYNYSTSTFTTVGMSLTVNSTVYSVDNLTLVSGKRDVPSGEYVRFSGFTVPVNKGSVGLWYAGSLISINLASFVQYGAAGQMYESVGDSAGVWVIGDFITGGLPLHRDNDYSSFGASHWAGGGGFVSIGENNLNDVISLGPVPFNEELTISFSSNSQNTKYTYEIFNVIGTSVINGTAIKQNKLVINTSLLAHGVYFVRITDNKGNLLTKRLVKN